MKYTRPDIPAAGELADTLRDMSGNVSNVLDQHMLSSAADQIVLLMKAVVRLEQQVKADDIKKSHHRTEIKSLISSRAELMRRVTSMQKTLTRKLHPDEPRDVTEINRMRLRIENQRRELEFYKRHSPVHPDSNDGIGNLDAPVPNHFDHTQRGFVP